MVLSPRPSTFGSARATLQPLPLHMPVRAVFYVLSGNGGYMPHLGMPQFPYKSFPANRNSSPFRVGKQVDGKVSWVPGSYLRFCPVSRQIVANRQLHSGTAISLPCKLRPPRNQLGHPFSVGVSVTPRLRHGLSATVLVMLLCRWGLPSRQSFPKIFVRRFHPRMNRPLPMLGQRVGEATNPGPQADIRSFFGSRTAQGTVPANSAQTASQASHPQPLTPTPRDAGQVALAVINPTSIHNKEDLVAGLRAHIIFASETSAVSFVQHSSGAKLQRHGLTTIWGSPVSPHVSAKTGLDTLRGHAAGVAIIGSLPLTHPCIALSETALASLRIVEAMTRLGNVQTRLICLYGYPASYRDARLRNQELFMQALHRVSLSRLPTIVAGDLNCCVQELPAWEHFRFLGYQEIFEFFKERHGTQLPPTCKGSSRHGTCLLPPAILHMFKSAWVSSDSKPFDSHDPILVSLQVDALPPILTWRQPQSWLQFGPDMDRAAFLYEGMRAPVQHAIDSAVTSQDISAAFTLWSATVEDSVHEALSEAHLMDPTKQPARGLPKAARGRCVEKQRSVVQPVAVSKKGRHGDYDPSVEAATVLSRRQVRQVRRLLSLTQRRQSLERNALPPSPPLAQQLQNEWRAILRSKAFPSLRPLAPVVGRGFSLCLAT